MDMNINFELLITYVSKCSENWKINKVHNKSMFTILDVGEFIAILFPSAGEALAKLSRNFPNIEQVKV